MQPTAGWYDDPSDAALVRFWDGDAWTGHTHAKWTRGIRREPRPPRYRLGVILLLLGVASAVLAGIAKPAYTAIPVTMTVLEPLAVAQCDTGAPLRVEFDWLGHRKTEDYYPDCTRDYAAGTSLSGFAESDDPSNLGPTARWILHPDEHDPLDPFGPDAAQGWLTLIALGCCISGVATLVVGLRRSRRRAATT